MHVRPDAQKIDASQTNRALLLSDGAVLDSKPQLEIYADDVKCSHGASIGQLDPDQIFYLRARGLDLERGPRAAQLRVREPGARAAPARGAARVARGARARLAAGRWRVSAPAQKPARPRFDAEAIAREFPILARKIHGKPLVYLDSAASSQKPARVIDAIGDYYRTIHANVHRGVHTLAEEATAAYEAARESVRGFLHAASPREIVFVRGTTEAINLVAQAYARPRLSAGDEVLVSEMEHHSNLVPWQMVCEKTGASLVVAPIDERGDIVREEYERRLSPRTRVVALAHVSNALGTVNPVAELAALGEAARRGRGRRRRAGRAAPARRRAGARLRLLRVLGPQDVRRRPASARSGAGSSCSTRWSPGRAAAP